MAFLIHYATHLPFGVVFFVINLPFYWLSVRRMGAAFTPSARSDWCPCSLTCTVTLSMSIA
ncbi:hypothetical protein BANRA_00017 [Klebsiella pneumoniae]|nr:hypothetical protein BANRA_00017 [Klebsiella pneumoniae]